MIVQETSLGSAITFVLISVVCVASRVVQKLELSLYE